MFTPSVSSASSACEDPALVSSGRCSTGVPFWKQRMTLIRHSSSLGLLAPRAVRNKFLFFMNYSVSGILPKYQEWIKIVINFTHSFLSFQIFYQYHPPDVVFLHFEPSAPSFPTHASSGPNPPLPWAAIALKPELDR